MEDKNIIGVQMSVSDFELVHQDLDTIKRMVNERFARDLSHFIVDHKLMEIVEYPDLMTNSKVFRGQAVVLTRTEYERLKDIERNSREAKQILSKNL
ncbi:hypothetical protein [Priestia megaterium]|uniref:hypothetical protein n=1 Tax=Priestia megaterium TaxID=1404 RepID=UPI000BEB46E4|nr:hypothetical protein [Priestia megaterium]PED64004.1 hypothetical protein CON20_23870 [Priestia megaterium]